MTYPQEVGPETPEEDAAEQRAEVVPSDEDRAQPAERDLETPEWDAQEQSEVVYLEDDYR